MKIRRRRAGFWRNASGAGALEFALVSPILFALFFGTFNLGYALYCGAAVRNAVQRASRSLVATPSMSASSLQSLALTKLTNVPANDFAVSLATETDGTAAGVYRVSWTYHYSLSAYIIPTMTLSMGSSLIVPKPTPG
jgi:Flp pilus assembly protein TadG